MYGPPALCPALSSFHSPYKTLRYSPNFTDEETEGHKAMCLGKEVRIQNLSPTDSRHPKLITAEPVGFCAQPWTWVPSAAQEGREEMELDLLRERLHFLPGEVSWD